MDLFESEASLIYIASFRLSRATSSRRLGDDSAIKSTAVDKNLQLQGIQLAYTWCIHMQAGKILIYMK